MYDSACQRARRCAAALAITAIITACGGGTDRAAPAPRAALLRVDYGRLVDIHAYRRIDPENADRRDELNRSTVLVQRDVVIRPGIESQSLFDAAGNENAAANYRFLPFDVTVGHEELLVLWDDTDPNERARFDAALQGAQLGLVSVPASHRGQSTNVRPIPMVPRNAAVVLTFDRDLALDDAYFQAHPEALQLLEFLADPTTTAPSLAYRPLAHRVVADGARLIVDPTLIGGEGGGPAVTGLPPSPDNTTANVRIAVPTGGPLSAAFRVEPDPVPQLNAVASSGEPAVVRDFRSGNASGGLAATLTDVEPPVVVAELGMGITAIDRAERTLTLNKRYADVAVRGRIPFVDGAIVPTTGLPGGPAQVPTREPLRSGDVLCQDVVSPTGERVRVRAEVLENLDVGNALGAAGFPAPGLAADGTDGGGSSLVRVRVATLDATDSAGNTVSFEASATPLGRDCTVRVHYYHYVSYTTAFGNAAVSDAQRALEFVVFDPAPPRLDANRNPVPAGSAIDPLATVSLRFSEPIDLDSVQPFDNFLLSNDSLRATASTTVARLLQEPKPTALSVVATRLIDRNNDGTLLGLTPPLGHFHQQGGTEAYRFHMLTGDSGATNPVRDLGGNPVDLYDRDLTAASDAFSVRYLLDPAAGDNTVGWRVLRFASADEDGTPVGSVDCFGQFRIENGALSAAPTTRFSRVADQQTLSGITRYDRGECGSTAPTPPLGVLYLCPSMVAVQPVAPLIPWANTPVTFGGGVEPHNPRGSRLQMTYREDDFGLSYRDPSDLMLDIEQMHWASWNNRAVEFDTFDRVTLAAAHADWRPDLLFSLVGGACTVDCASMLSGLRTTFAANVLQGSSEVTLAKDAVYQIDPNRAFQSISGQTMVPFVQFERSYTWRDSRLLTWDMVTDQPVGLSGAKQPNGVFPGIDRTANVSSPWVPDVLPAGFTGTQWTVGQGDFLGTARRDMDPIAMPLLLDFKVFPDDPGNGVALGSNLFHIGYVGPCWTAPPWPPNSPGGYYSAGGYPGCNGLTPPAFRVHTSGGVDAQGNEILVDPDSTTVATGGWIVDPGMGDPQLGRYQTPPGDDHLLWAQADFARKVSMVTFGFFDSQAPNQHALLASKFPSAWPGLANQRGFPDFAALGGQYAISDLLAIPDPPQSAQPPGTAVRIELRGAASFGNAVIYDQANDDGMATRGNLLNPNYACEAYRYASRNQGVPVTARIPASGLTPYVTTDDLDLIRTGGVLPRLLNLRVIFHNATDVTPPLSPSLRSLAVAYRMVPN